MSSTGSVLYICDAPSHLDFGIDCQSYETGPKFRGVSMIPPGLHLVYFGTGLGARQGFFFFCEGNELVVRSWDRVNEEITATNVLSEESTKELESALYRGLLNDQLGPYPLAQHHTWLNLTCCVSSRVLERSGCTPGISIVLDSLTKDSDPPIQPGLSKAFVVDATTCTPQFANISLVESRLKESILKDYSTQTKAESLTSLFRDKSRVLEELVETFFDQSWSDLLGEAQLAFMLFLLLFSAPALEHWKSVVNLVSSSESAVKSRPQFTSDFIKSFHSQLNFTPSDFFDMELSRENFLRPTFSALFAALSGDDLAAPLREVVRRMLKFVSEKFHIYQSDDGMRFAAGRDTDDMFNLISEDMPVVVSLGDQLDFNNEEASSTSTSSFTRQSLVSQEKQLYETIQQKWDQYLLSPIPLSTTPETLVDTDTCHLHLKTTNYSKPSVSAEAGAMSPTERETELFRWRYPLLYDAMRLSAGKEDMVMTAVRILETSNCPIARREAQFFVEHEEA